MKNEKDLIKTKMLDRKLIYFFLLAHSEADKSNAEFILSINKLIDIL